MHQFFQFVAEHWVLWSVLLVILILIIGEEQKTGGAMIGRLKNMSPELVVDSINHNDAIVVDVRSADEYVAGHIINSINIPAADIEKSTSKLSRYKKKPLILMGAPNHLNKLAKLLGENNFERLYCMSAGIDGWKKAGYPVNKGVKSKRSKKK